MEIVPLYGPAGAAILEAARTHEPDIVRGTQRPVFLVRAGGTGRVPTDVPCPRTGNGSMRDLCWSRGLRREKQGAAPRAWP
jgi:hypothetical protein